MITRFILNATRNYNTDVYYIENFSPLFNSGVPSSC